MRCIRARGVAVGLGLLVVAGCSSVGTGTLVDPASVPPSTAVVASESAPVTGAPAVVPSPSVSVDAAPTGPPPAATPTRTRGTSSATPDPSAAGWTVTRIVDGDTIHVARGDTTAKVRIIGIDTPEIGECGYRESAEALRAIIDGRPVTLTAGARDAVDRYGRLLRHVDVGGTDAGLALITQGRAVARYDSRDGYGAHDREVAYIGADAASPVAPCAAPVPTAPATTAPGGGSGGTDAGWPLPGDEHPCPAGQPVKGNEPSMIAHRPGNQSYLVTNPEACFASMDDAVAAGFRPARR